MEARSGAAADTEEVNLEDDAAFEQHLKEMMSRDPSSGNSSSSGVPSLHAAGNTTNGTQHQPAEEAFSGQGQPFQQPYANPPASYPPPNPQTIGSPVSKIDQVKSWTIDTLRTTKQFINEKLGKGTKTVDPALDGRITDLRLLQHTYTKLVEQTSSLQNYFSNVLYTQRQMCDTFAELAQRDSRLAEDFNYNSETQRVLIRNGEQLIGALQFFIASMKTLCSKTIQDCLDTVKKYELARLQYDTFRNEHEKDVSSGAPATGKTADIRNKYEQHKKRFEQLRDDVGVKMRFLDENKVKVVHRQLLLFHNAIAAYFSGNQKQLQSVLSQFSVKLRTPNAEPPSWLEN